MISIPIPIPEPTPEPPRPSPFPPGILVATGVGRGATGASFVVATGASSTDCSSVSDVGTPASVSTGDGVSVSACRRRTALWDAAIFFGAGGACSIVDTTC